MDLFRPHIYLGRFRLNALIHFLIGVIGLAIASCSSSSFSGSSGAVKNPPKKEEPKTAEAKKQPGKVVAPAPHADGGAGEPPALPSGCAKPYQVPASSNIWLAGVPDGTSLTYIIPRDQLLPYTTIDRAPAQSPVLVADASQGCLLPGYGLTFSVSGQISHGGDAISDANGLTSENTRHRNGGVLGKSDLTAPINSLVAVFVGDGDVSAQAVPQPMDFSSDASRNQARIAPALGQVFFIGTGVIATGESRVVLVPDGATRLYFGVMDAYEWNNNTGSLSGALVSTANYSN